MFTNASSPNDHPQSSTGGQESGAPSPLSAPPAISLPKGGGAIRGIGEKFAANPVTGSGSLSVPLATSPGRAGFGPQLALAYDSGAGNGPFGFGWSLDLPRINRKTDKGLPQYRDAEESDVFILSGAEDLVPLLQPDGRRFVDDSTDPDYTIHRYRPRIEGLFARIERWTRRRDGDVHWRSISKDNTLTIYGQDEKSRIADPDDPRCVFTWLICETRDDKGNAVLYEYKTEDGTGVDLSRTHERNRGDRHDPRRTANRYLKRIRYGNRAPLLDNNGQRPHRLTAAQIENAGWLFEVVFDYGEHEAEAPGPDETGEWSCRADPFSSYRTGFEVRTYRLCQRVLMFHHFEDEAGVGPDCLVRSTDFTYDYEQNPAAARQPVYSFLVEVTQSGYKRQADGYLQRSLPPVEFEYTLPVVQDTVKEVEAANLKNLPTGLDGATYQWTDLHGEGLPGILTEQGGAWFYKRNLSPISERLVEFAPLERVAVKPSLALGDGAQFMDLAGDGQPDLVVLDGPMPGLYEHDGNEGWQPFRPFISRLTRDSRDPNLRFVDLDGGGHADVLITEDEAFVWHPSLAEAGFGPANRVAQALDEEQGPRLVLADSAQSIYLADLSGDGLTDLVRIRNGQVCYWPNLGYGRFGAKVTMDNAPRFDHPDQFDPRRLRLADIDGTGTTDLIYLHRDGVRLYFNQSGNSWSTPQRLSVFPRPDDLASIVPVDLLGNGTACLVWSSPLPADAQHPMRYVDLTGGQKPHLLVGTVNNLGAETRIRYAPSTKFYLQDKHDGKPWLTRLPFPVHVVERVETYDHLSCNRFVTRYAYHHGYFDGVEREFRGFGLVEQWDTEEYAALTASQDFPAGDNIDAASHVPPVLTKTWFHTGAYLGRDHISNFYAGLLDGDDPGEYYREPGLTDAQTRDLLLEDTVLPAGLTGEEAREACRALKGAMLRQEVYALDGTGTKEYSYGQPYVITEQDFTVRLLQPEAANRYAVFLAHAREAITYQYDRNPDDPRISHALTLEVDDFGNVLKSAAVGYGRRQPDKNLPAADQAKQAQILITYTENAFTNPIDGNDVYRTPLPSETRTYELTGLALANGQNRFSLDAVREAGTTAIPLAYEAEPGTGQLQKRLIEHVRTLYRPDDLGLSRQDTQALLPLGQVESLALAGESYKLVLTPGLIAKAFGGKVTDGMLEEEGRFVHSAGDTNWWIPSGRHFLSPGTDDDPATELAHARAHFFLPHRFRDPFHREGFETESVVSYGAHDLLMVETRDALGNTVTALNDYRVLQPQLLTDPNHNRTEVAFDTLGMVVGTAVMGKESEHQGDSLAGFNADLDEATRLAHLDNPGSDPHAILQRATTRMVYDLFAYQRTKSEPQPQPAVVYALARETHDADLAAGELTKIQHSFSYSDGFGREIQKKIQAEPGSIVDGGEDVNPRWVGSGWTVSNNKGQPVRQFEPFFTATHRFEFNVRIGVSPILFYDPLQRGVATLNPNHTWQKVVFGPWRQETWDVNDTVLLDPRTDTDVGAFMDNYFAAVDDPPGSWETWYAQRIDGGKGNQEQAAANKAAAHAGTATVAHFDTLGRPFLTIADNGTAGKYETRIELDIEGNQREVIDAKGRAVMRYDYDMLSSPIHSTSMDAGQRWMLNDVAGQPIRAWDGRGHAFRTEYDQLHRPVRQFVRGRDAVHSDSRVLNREVLFQKTEYGDGQADDVALNLRTQVFKQYDTAGVVTSLGRNPVTNNDEAYDFKGNLLRGSRQLAADYKTVPDWAVAVALDPDLFSSSTTYDALNRPISLISPDNSEIQPTYNEANLLEQVRARLRGAAEWTTFVADIDYNAKGHRERIDFGNGVRTEYSYDPLTFRLMRLFTRRDEKAFPDDCPATPPVDWPGCAVQNLHYTYDPVGNITHIRDDAQQTIFFRNRRVEPSNDYLYDATYQLIEATGREHLGQIGGGPIPHSANDGLRVGVLHPGDGQAVGTYLETYVYDVVGNILQMQHRGSNPAHPGWTRSYDYSEPNLIESAKTSNRLSSTTVGSGNPTTERYIHDVHGNMTRMPHLGGAQPDPNMVWDYRDQLCQSDLGGGGTAYYVYDSTGQRVRKVWEKAPGLTEERLYLGGFEIFRRRNGAGTVTLERETLHVMDDQQHIALVETRTLDTAGVDPAPPQLIRYQFGNHLGSASLELDDQAQIISYEEYTPYGSTSYQAVRSQTETPKRYRYSGMERDEETGLAYHGARYYAVWLGRWIACDPIGIAGGSNIYSYADGQPMNFTDPDGRQPFIAPFIAGLLGCECRPAQIETEKPTEPHQEVEQPFELPDTSFEAINDWPVFWKDASEAAVVIQESFSTGVLRSSPSDFETPSLLTETSQRLLELTKVSKMEHDILYFVTAEKKEGVLYLGQGKPFQTDAMRILAGTRDLPTDTEFVMYVHSHPTSPEMYQPYEGNLSENDLYFFGQSASKINVVSVVSETSSPDDDGPPGPGIIALFRTDRTLSAQIQTKLNTVTYDPYAQRGKALNDLSMAGTQLGFELYTGSLKEKKLSLP